LTGGVMGSIRRLRPEVVVDARAEHGEGPAWDAGAGRLLWVDIVGRRLHWTDRNGGDTTESFDQGVCVAVPRAAGGIVLALAAGIWLEAPDGTRRQAFALADVEPDAAVLRMNDGKTDPTGRFWVGSTSNDGRTGAASLYRLDADGTTTRVLGGVSVSNG